MLESETTGPSTVLQDTKRRETPSLVNMFKQLLVLQVSYIHDSYIIKIPICVKQIVAIFINSNIELNLGWLMVDDV